MNLLGRLRRYNKHQVDTTDPLVAALLDDCEFGVLVVDRAGQIARTNQRLRRMLGASGETAVSGVPIETILTPADRAGTRAALQRALHDGAPTAQLKVRFAGATPNDWVTLSLTPLREGDGTASSALVRLSCAQPELEYTQQQKLLAAGDMVGGMAHEFNNLLTAVIGAADAVLERCCDDPDSVEDLRQIRRSADRGADLIRQMMAFGRCQPLAARVVAVNDAIRALQTALNRTAGAQVRLELELEEPGRQVRMDPAQLDHVLIQVAANARDAMPQGGTLTLRTGHRTLYQPEMTGSEIIPPGRYVVIEAGDTGEGIPPDILPRVFEPFFTTRRTRGNSGLGLSTVHGIIRQSGGFVALESTVGRGTRLSLWLPRHESEEAAQSTLPAPSPAIPSPPSRVVLLVEDEATVRYLAERALSSAGWQVLGAESAEAALAIMPRPENTTAPPAALVSDVILPGMDGVALVRAVRKIWPGLPVVLVSGYAESVLRGDLAGEDATFLPKPYRLKELVAHLEHATTPSMDVHI